MPSLTRSGRPSFSFASRPPSGSTFTALRVRSPLIAGATLACVLALFRRKARAPKRRRIRKLRLLALLVVLSLLGLAAFTFGLLTAIAAQIPDLDPAPAGATPAGEHLRLRERREDDPRDPPRFPGADRRPVGGHLALAEARDRGGRGQALLRASRRRRAQHPARDQGGHHEPRRGAGRLDDHAAVRQERDQPGRAHDLAQVAGGCARVATRADEVEGLDPDCLPEHRVLRQRGVRRGAGVPRLLRARRRDGRHPDGRGGRPGRASRRVSPASRACTTPSPIQKPRSPDATSSCA